MINPPPLEKFESRAVLVGVIDKRQDEEQMTEYLEELAFLARTADIIPVKTLHKSYPILTIGCM